MTSSCLIVTVRMCFSVSVSSSTRWICHCFQTALESWAFRNRALPYAPARQKPQRRIPLMRKSTQQRLPAGSVVPHAPGNGALQLPGASAVRTSGVAMLRLRVWVPVFSAPVPSPNPPRPARAMARVELPRTPPKSAHVSLWAMRGGGARSFSPKATNTRILIPFRPASAPKFYPGSCRASCLSFLLQTSPQTWLVRDFRC